VIGIVIVAHGGLAREYLAAIEHVVGKQKGIRAISIEYDHDRRQPSRTRSAAPPTMSIPGEGVLVVTDMFGGSPSNLSLPACMPANRRILYGANLPMLIKLAKSRHFTVAEATALALEAGRKYINCIEVSGGRGV
jgi:mannose PTS system EIIA component